MSESGLRERKKQATKRAIVTAGFKLFRDRGFEATTIDEIAAAANVAPRTFFRYFKTKEDLFSANQPAEDAVLLKTMRERRPGDDELTLLGRAVRAIMSLDPETMEETVGMMELTLTTPALRAHVLQEMLRTEKLIVEALLGGRKASKLELFRLETLASAGVGAFFSAFTNWVEGGRKANLLELLDHCEGWLRSGFAQKK